MQAEPIDLQPDFSEAKSRFEQARCSPGSGLDLQVHNLQKIVLAAFDPNQIF
jgi:hypothetical protein